MSLDPERTKLYREVQALLAGHPAQRAAAVAADTLAGMVGFLAESPQEADRLLDELLPCMKETIRDNWKHLREARSAALMSSAIQ